MHSVGGTLGSMYDSLTLPASGPPPKQRKERKLSLLLRRTAEPLHCAGVESLALSDDGGTLFTASRDATVRSWRAGGGGGEQEQQQPAWRPAACFEGHSNWVNDAVLAGGALVTCSSDCTVAVWDAAATGAAEPLGCLHSHSDYVTRLAAAADMPRVASAGLRGQVFVWDLPTQLRVWGQGQQVGCVDQASPHGSVYALDLNARGSMVAVGSPEGLIRVSDARSSAKAFRLRGHTDNVRDLLLNEEGTLCLSASSDNSIRLWDLGQQRCVHTFAVHTDSVWSLWAPPDFSEVVSGGRDCCVYRTHLASRASELLLEEGAAVTKLLAAPGGRLWVATASSSVRQWGLPAPAWAGGGSSGVSALHAPAAAAAPGTPRTPKTPGRALSGRLFHASPSPQLRQRQRFAGGARPEAAGCSVTAELRGLPPLARLEVLPDRRHVLTQDSAGAVELWDVAQGAVAESLGQADFSEAQRRHFRPESVAPWFTADVRLGSLCLHLEPPSCFAAELYAQELGREECPDDLKHNCGEHLLRAALGAWVRGLAADFVASGSPHGLGPSELAAAAESAFQLDPQLPLVVMGTALTEGGQLRPWAKAASALDGSERIGEAIPQWAADAVLHRRYPTPPELKCAFLLLPVEGCGLPSLLQSRLNAPRILRIVKVAAYVQGKLRDEGFELEPRRLFHDPGWQAQLEAQRREAHAAAGSQAQPQQELEFLCAGCAVPFDLSLAAVRAFIWKRPDTLCIQFRIFNPARPAPLPVIKPP